MRNGYYEGNWLLLLLFLLLLLIYPGRDLICYNFLSIIFSIFINNIEFNFSNYDNMGYLPKLLANTAATLYTLFLSYTFIYCFNNTSNKNSIILSLTLSFSI